MIQNIPAVWGAVFTRLLRTVHSIESQGMREPVDMPTASSAPMQSFSRQHDAISGGEVRFSPVLTADGGIAETLTVFRNVRSMVPFESQMS